MNGAVRKSQRQKPYGTVPNNLVPLLKFIGVPRDKIPCGIGFWRSEWWILEDVLKLARETYKAAMKRVFPRLHGSDGKEAALLNVAMDRIETLFERCGRYVKTWERVRLPIPQATCRHGPCGMVFQPLHRNQEFCCKHCSWNAAAARRRERLKISLDVMSQAA
jgi:hypothetical protein